MGLHVSRQPLRGQWASTMNLLVKLQKNVVNCRATGSGGIRCLSWRALTPSGINTNSNSTAAILWPIKWAQNQKPGREEVHTPPPNK